MKLIIFKGQNYTVKNFAEKVNLTPQRVRQRLAKGESCDDIVLYRKRGRGRPAKGFEIPWDEVPVGEVSDAEIARAYNCNKRSVINYRKRHGIPAFNRVSK
jgi:predicted ArsR family transcriptional regulator